MPGVPELLLLGKLQRSPEALSPPLSFLSPLRRYPWGQEAFDKAKKENKLIFLSGKQKQGAFNTPEGVEKPGCGRVVVRVEVLGTDSPPARDAPCFPGPGCREAASRGLLATTDLKFGAGGTRGPCVQEALLLQQFVGARL